MNRQELLTELALNLDEWPCDIPEPPIKGLWSTFKGQWVCSAKGHNIVITREDWSDERRRLINKPSLADIPTWAVCIAQIGSGTWRAYDKVPERHDGDHWVFDTMSNLRAETVSSGAIPAGHRWQDTLERVGPAWRPGVDLPPEGTVCELAEAHEAGGGRSGYVGPRVPSDAGKKVKICKHLVLDDWPIPLAAYVSLYYRFGGVGGAIAFRAASDDQSTGNDNSQSDTPYTPEEDEAWREIEASLTAKAAADRAIQEEADNPTPPAYILTDAPAMDWDTFYLGMAQYVATKSKDPSTGVGAVIVRPDRTVAALGFNGFPRNAFDDTDRMAKDRNWKLARMIHAEVNAIINAKEPLDDCTLYVWPMPPCSHCAAVVAQAGITRVVAPEPSERWLVSCNAGRNLLDECSVSSEWR